MPSSFTQLYLRETWINAAVALAIVVAALPLTARLIDRFRSIIASIARPLLRFEFVAPLIGAGFAFVLGLVPTMCGWVAPPSVHDEISYLLSADTFLHGRLTNPTPAAGSNGAASSAAGSRALWRHFQTMHEIMVPTYASKFPPGQGIALAVGSLLGSPRVGAFGAIALATAATCWMMRAVLPAGWALIGALLAACSPLLHAWGLSFWGGGVAMIGGALLSGAVLRAMQPNRRPTDRVIDGTIIGIGAAILMNSRPFEGALLGLLLAVWLLSSSRLRGRDVLRHIAVWSAPGAILVLLPVLAWMGYYNYRVTGHALRLPYAEHASQYMRAPIFYWQSPPQPKPVGVPHLDAFFRDYEQPEWQRQTTLGGFMHGVNRKLRFIVADVFRPIVMLPVIALGGLFAIRRHPAARIAWWISIGLVALHVALTPWLRIQYLAVIAPLFVLFATMALRELDAPLRSGWRSRPIGSAIAIVLLIAMPVYCLKFDRDSTRDPELVGRGRERTIEFIESQPGRHIVLVHYADGPQSLYEWVYNSADIDSQRVIWAHALDPASNTALVEHYADRSVWLLTANGDAYHAERLMQR